LSSNPKKTEDYFLLIYPDDRDSYYDSTFIRLDGDRKDVWADADLVAILKKFE